MKRSRRRSSNRKQELCKVVASDTTTVLRLIQNETNIDGTDIQVYNALWKGCAENDFSLVQLLLEDGAIIDAADQEGRTPLIIASRNDNVEVIRILLKHDANVLATDKKGWTALHQACFHGWCRTVELLLRHHADVNAYSLHASTPLILACVSQHTRIVSLLLEKGADVNVHPRRGGMMQVSTALHEVCKNGNHEIAVLLIRHGANVNAFHRRTPLHIACHFGFYSLCNLLLDNAAAVNVYDLDGITPLYKASLNGQDTVVMALLNHGADVGAVCNGSTALHNAYDSQTVKVLLDHGADINAQDKNGWTPLHIACCRRHDDISRMLLRNGANPNVADRQGQTPLYIAGSSACVLALLQHGADPNVVDRVTGWTPLHHACKFHKLDTVRHLLKHGADVRTMDNNGYTPLHMLLADTELYIGRILTPVISQPDFVHNVSWVTNILEVTSQLINCGTHVDVVSINNDTAHSHWTNCHEKIKQVINCMPSTLSSENSDIAARCRVILESVNKQVTERYSLNLQCMAARTIICYNVDYFDHLPQKLVHFVQDHGSRVKQQREYVNVQTRSVLGMD